MCRLADRAPLAGPDLRGLYTQECRGFISLDPLYRDDQRKLVSSIVAP